MRRHAAAGVLTGAAAALAVSLTATPATAAGSIGGGYAHAGGGAGTRTSVAPATTTTPPGYTVRGIDTSSYQGTVDWASVAASQARFAYLKATEGVGYVDPSFASNYPAAKAQGLYVGSYAFARPDNPPDQGATQQADYLVANGGWTADGKTLPPMLDIEAPYMSGTTLNSCWDLTPDQMVAWIQAFVDEIRAKTNVSPVIYTSASWWNLCTAGSAAFSDLPLFAADWTNPSPAVPTGWSNWTLWQYSDSGSLPGDQDVYNGGIGGLAKLAGGVAGQPDVTGDGYADIQATKSDGSLWLYPNNTTGTPFDNGRQVGAGWGTFSRIMPADVTGDGFSDLLTMKSDGTLWLYANSGTTTPYASGQQVGSGWGIFNRIMASDVTGDGYADVVATKSDGTLWLYTNTGGATPYVSGKQIGSGWGIFDRLMLADMNQDGLADIVATKSDGTLWLYRSNGTSTPYTSGQQVGSGWTVFPKLVAADYNADRYADLLGVKSDGTMWLYRNSGASTPFSSGQQVGSGWTGFDRIF